MRLTGWIFIALLGLAVLAAAVLQVRQVLGDRKAEQLFAQMQVEPVSDIGSTPVLRILPLMEYHTADPSLHSEVGVSYLVETADHRILYDVGQNGIGGSPSPLQQNMAKLGVELASIDKVFISHNHFDHVGGMHWQRLNTFSLGSEQQPFPNPRTQLIAPDTMSYPGMPVVYADRPMRLGDGVGTTGLGTTGTIGRQLAIGWIEEHSLVVMVEGLGGVMIVGCGHQSLPRLLQRYDAAYRQPLYGIVGGLHFPVPEGRIKMGPLDGQRRFATGGGIFDPLTMPEVMTQVAMLKERQLGVIGVSGHDSSDEVIELVRREFGDAHRYVRVGEEIIIGGPLR